MDSTSYSFSVPTPLWEQWTATIPRDEVIEDRLRQLVAEDALDRTNGDLDGKAAEYVTLLADREVERKR